jgi:hypothetical protein
MGKSRSRIWAEHVARMEENMNAYRISVGKSEGNRPLGRLRERIILKFISEKYDSSGSG